MTETNFFIRHVLYPVLGAAGMAVLAHVMQGGDFTAQDLLLDALAAGAGALYVLFDPKGGKDRPWLAK